MKNIFENLSVNIKIWLWNWKREKNRIKKTRSFYEYQYNKLTFYPYESDYEYLITKYCENNKHELSKLEDYSNVHPFVFRLHMQNGEIRLGFPVRLSKKLLTLRKEETKPDGYHTALKEEFNIYLFEIEHISAIRDYDDFHAVYEEKPIFGYKSIRDENGILLAKEHKYEINEKNEVEIKNPYITDYQDCYLHFCTSIECVALCPGPTNYLSSIKDYVKGQDVIRLFRVKAEGHCKRINGDWWVTNTLTVLEEVDKKEIYQYYMENPKAKEQVSAHCKLSENFWEEFCNSEITPYVNNSQETISNL